MTTWVLLRGLARESRHWGEFPRLLQQALPAGDEVLALDLPGNGSRWRERSPASVEALAEAARAEWQRRGAPGPVVLVALSLGGMVALQWAMRHTAEVRGCVLVNSSLRGLAMPWQRLRPRALAELLFVALRGDAHARERRVLRLTSNYPVCDATAEDWTAHARSAPVSRANMLRQLLAAARFRAPRAAPPVPLLLLASTQDRLASVLCSRAMARAWQAPLVEHPTAGHDLALDEPAWFARQVAQWAVPPAGASAPRHEFAMKLQ
ncbi:MAG: alpha/beta hydrolase [Comamonadaceae bacterium]|nr:MAG: alpha/beta hydrolase [Comamonadaceae bacterium]